MRTLLVLAAIVGLSAPSFAQTAAPKVGGKPLVQVKPKEPIVANWSEQLRARCGPAIAQGQQSSGAQHPQNRVPNDQIEKDRGRNENVSRRP
jgi:hypothetical protein